MIRCCLCRKAADVPQLFWLAGALFVAAWFLCWWYA